MSSSPPGRESHEMRSRESAGSRPSAVEPANGEGSELRTRLTKVYEDSLAETRAQTDAPLGLL